MEIFTNTKTELPAVNVPAWAQHNNVAWRFQKLGNHDRIQDSDIWSGSIRAPSTFWRSLALKGNCVLNEQVSSIKYFRGTKWSATMKSYASSTPSNCIMHFWIEVKTPLPDSGWQSILYRYGIDKTSLLEKEWHTAAYDDDDLLVSFSIPGTTSDFRVQELTTDVPTHLNERVWY